MSWSWRRTAFSIGASAEPAFLYDRPTRCPLKAVELQPLQSIRGQKVLAPLLDTADVVNTLHVRVAIGPGSRAAQNLCNN